MSEQPYYGGQLGSTPTVVQGQVINDGKQTPIMASTYDHHQPGFASCGEKLEIEKMMLDRTRPSTPANPGNKCNDLGFGIVFILHLISMVYITLECMPVMLSGLGSYNNDDGNERRSRHLEWASRWLEDGENNNEGNIAPEDLILLVSVTGAATLFSSSITLLFMMKFASLLIKAALIFNIVMCGLMVFAGFAGGNSMLVCLGFIFMVLSMCYTIAVWNRIEFAASNLICAVSAVRANLGGLVICSYVSLVILFGWTLLWTSSFLSGMYVYLKCEGMECNDDSSAGLISFLFFLSFYWTQQVIQNIVHVTVAGTVGTWWFSPEEANSCCSSAIRGSLFRAVTYSFGSICFGSLIVAIIQALKEMARQSRESGDMLACCAECLLGCLESIAEYFNKWAYVFVGLYGYSFMKAGKEVINLFRERGWTTIITDYLIDRVLMMVSVGNGILMGILAIFVTSFNGMDFSGIGGLFTPFLIGLITGMVLTSVLMSIVSSAVNTIIVCYAEAPQEFQKNNPELFEQMRISWRQAYPQEFKY